VLERGGSPREDGSCVTPGDEEKSTFLLLKLFGRTLLLHTIHKKERDAGVALLVAIPQSSKGKEGRNHVVTSMRGGGGGKGHHTRKPFISPGGGTLAYHRRSNSVDLARVKTSALTFEGGPRWAGGGGEGEGGKKSVAYLS